MGGREDSIELCSSAWSFIETKLELTEGSKRDKYLSGKSEDSDMFLKCLDRRY